MAEEIIVIVNDSQEEVSLFVSTPGGGGVTTHSALTLDDGTNPHATTIDDVNDGTVAFKDEANIFTEKQTINLVAAVKQELQTSGIKNATIETSEDKLIIRVFDNSGISTAFFEFNQSTKRFLGVGVDIGEDSAFGRWKGLFLSSFAKAIGYKTISNSSTNNFLKSNGDIDTTTKGLIDTNTAKVTNVSTNLSEGTTTNTTVDVDSSDGTNATIAAASTSRAGVMTKAKFDEVVVNNAKTGVTNEEQNTINTEVEAGMTGEDLVLNVLSLTTAEYGAGTPIATTFYIITDA